MHRCNQSSKTANSEALRLFDNSPRTFTGISAVPHPLALISRLLGQLPLLPAAPALAKQLEGLNTTSGAAGIRLDWIFFAA
jgi:hypothetical protein